MNVATCEALAQIMPVLLIALIAERVAFKQAKNRKTTTFKLAGALVRTSFEFVLALVIIGSELGFLDGVDSHGFTGQTARGYWALVVLMLISILYRWLLLSPSVIYAFDRVFDLIFNGIRRLLERIAATSGSRNRRLHPLGEAHRRH